MSAFKTRRLVASLALVLGAFSLVAAGPLGAIKDAANDSRDQMETAQAETERAAENAVTVREGAAADVKDRAGESDPATGRAEGDADTHTGVTVREGVAADPVDHEGHDHGDMKEGHDDDAMHGDARMMVQRAKAVLMSASGSEVDGTVTFRQTEEGVAVTANVTGLEPNSKHGIHVHEFGDVSSDDGSAMGGHYNPEGHAHALPSSGDMERHAGDFGNLEADADGNATFNMTFDNISIAGKKNPILGRGLVIHEKADDGGQPTGNAGARIAQAVIGVAE